MSRLPLSPLPCPRTDECSGSGHGEMDGFVDEAVVRELLAGPFTSRPVAKAEDLALAADELDFAGWSLPPVLAVRSAQSSSVLKETDQRRAAPPELAEPGLGLPHRGNHRWWLAGLAGALTTMLFSVLLLSLSSRVRPELEGVSLFKATRNPDRSAETSKDEKDAPALTTLPPDK